MKAARSGRNAATMKPVLNEPVVSASHPNPRWAQAGKLQYVRTLGGHRRYRAADVEALLGGELAGVFEGGLKVVAVLDQRLPAARLAAPRADVVIQPEVLAQHLAALHQVAARVVGDHGVRHAMLRELPRGQQPLVAGPRLVDPHVDVRALVMRKVDRRGQYVRVPARRNCVRA